MKKILLAFFLTSILGACSTVTHSKANVEFINPASDQPQENRLPFSPAVRVGNTIYLSGSIGIDPDAGKLVDGGIEAETHQTMTNIKNTLAANGLSMNNLVKCTVMLTDIKEWAAFNKVYRTYFTGSFPARSAFGASGLALNAKVEVECIAADF